MSEQKHTPGPWLIDEGAEMQEPGFYGAPGDPNGYHAISADGWRVTGFIGEANAKLIAAAPELLEALRKAEFRLAKLVALNDEEPGIASPDDAAALEQVRAAVAKAEGRSWEAAREAIDKALGR